MGRGITAWGGPRSIWRSGLVGLALVFAAGCERPTRPLLVQPAPVPIGPLDLTPETLRFAASHAGKLVGTSFHTRFYAEEMRYGPTLKREFNYITPENEMKWAVLQPTEDPNYWNWEGADTVVAFAEAHGQKVKGHTLIWGRYKMPPFITAETSAEQLNGYLKSHVEQTVGRYKGRIYSWDVCNEAFEDEGPGLRTETPQGRLWGEGWMDRVFHWAHEADPDVILLYNDFSMSWDNVKQRAILREMIAMRDRGVPIHGVGMQMHFRGDQNFSKRNLMASFKRFTDEGFLVNISEMETRMANFHGSPQEKLERQAEIFWNVAAACAATPGCDSMTTWGFSDLHATWIDSFFEPDDPLQLGDSYERKPAYYAQIKGFELLPR